MLRVLFIGRVLLIRWAAVGSVHGSRAGDCRSWYPGSLCCRDQFFFSWELPNGLFFINRSPSWSVYSLLIVFATTFYLKVYHYLVHNVMIKRRVQLEALKPGCKSFTFVSIIHHVTFCYKIASNTRLCSSNQPNETR
jgi:hypothetical protein